MDGGKSGPKKRLIGIAIVILFLLFRNYSDILAEHNLILPVVVLVFVAAFGALLWQAIKEWKKSDEDILRGYLPIYNFFSGSGNIDLSKQVLQFVGVVVVLALFMHSAKDYPGSVSRYIIFVVSLLLVGIPLLRAWLVKRRGADAPSKLRHPEAVAAILVSLIPIGFMCFFCWIGISHGVWWFILPPGSIFLVWFTRPLVAGIRVLLKNAKDPDDRHVRKGKEQDPWDRPDRNSSDDIR